MDIQERIEKQIALVIQEEFGEKIQPEKTSAIIKKLTEKITLAVTPDELVLLRMNMEQKAQRELAVVSVIGHDSIGIVAEVTKALADSRANIEGMNQAIVSGYFALILTIDVTEMTVTMDELQKLMDEIAERKNLRIYIQHENIFKSMNRI